MTSERTFKFSQTRIDKINEPGRYRDASAVGLYLNAAASPKKGITKSWVYRFMLDGRSREMGLGSADLVPVSGGQWKPIISLDEARDLAYEAKRSVMRRVDPIEARDAEERRRLAERSKRLTFREAAEKCIAVRETGWKNAKHRKQWTATLATYAFPTIGDTDVAKIDEPLVAGVLKPIWQSKHQTAGRLRQRVEVILDWAKAHGHRTGDNPATIKALAHRLPDIKKEDRRVRHHPAMPWLEIGTFFAALRQNSSISARALEFTILTAKRTSEVIGARWDEIDLTAKTWTIPASRIKAAREHRVPLSPRCLEILGALPRARGNDFVFIGAKAAKGLSNMAMLELLKGMDDRGFTVHGFRSSFKDWAAESTGFPGELSEAQLSHVLKDETQAAYERGDKLAKRAKMMQAWERYCAQPPRAEADNVLSMRAKA